MKKLFYSLICLPFLANAQKADDKPFEGYFEKDCYIYVASELTKPDGIFKNLTAGKVTEDTKTIYLTTQTYLGKKLADTTINGVRIVQTNVDSVAKASAKDFKKHKAAAFHITNMILRPDTCDVWVFPINVKKSLFKCSTEYSSTGCKAKFFFNQSPPKFIYRRTDCEEL